MTLKEKYNKEIAPKLVKELGLKNVMQAPKLVKVVLNVGVSSKHKDTNVLESATNTLKKITGQKPLEKKAKKSISAFKIRGGQIVGLSVTLRKGKMYDFVERFVTITLPRVRDFRGLNPKSFDGEGNYSIGFKEQIAFPEVTAIDAEKLHGLEMVIVTTAKTDKEAKELLTLIGFPFRK